MGSPTEEGMRTPAAGRLSGRCSWQPTSALSLAPGPVPSIREGLRLSEIRADAAFADGEKSTATRVVCAVGALDLPGIAGVEELAELALALLALRRLDLLRHQGVVDRTLDRSEDPDRCWAVRGV